METIPSIKQAETLGSMIFKVGGKEFMRIGPDGQVTLRGEKVGYAKDILDGFREFLRLAKIERDGGAT